MECNKDEAVRAKRIAEDKMMKNDFEGARRLALKAKQLFPELDNISQLLAVCDVHCSAQRKIHGGEKDLYGILQVENLADDTTIKKQYRKLALVLHPDKNKLPGAEAAFKLIGEANIILSDKGKRYLHDVKCREPAKSIVPRPQNKNHNDMMRLQSFWTQCPFCKIKHEYHRDIVNRPMRCRNCLKPFIAVDMGVQRAAPPPHSAYSDMQSGRPAFFQQKEVGRQGNVNIDLQTAQKKPSEATINKGTNRKKGRKMVVESSDEEASVGTDVGSHRRSSRKRAQVSYSEEACDDGLSPAKRCRQDRQKKQDNVCNTADDVKKDVPKPKASDHSKSDSDSEDKSEPVYIDCPDLEFSNFDKEKEEHCFAFDQIWACYDTIDGMPRFYAHIRKVYSSGFRLRITWLEADPENDLEIIWAEEGLPVACGKFVHGDTEETIDRLMFSHQIVYQKGMTRFSYVIYPKKGEIWALFKDWDIKWGSDNTKFKFDIVEILSDFDNDNGVVVAYMVKVEGFVSLFHRTKLDEHTIPSGEVFRFSHRIPSVKLTGTERADVPVGSCELDTAALPDDINDYCFSKMAKVKPESIFSQTSASCSQSPEPKNETGGLKGNLEQSNGVEVKCNNAQSPEPKNETDGLKGNLEQSDGVEVKCDNAQSCETKNEAEGLKGNLERSKEADLVIHDFNEDKQNRKFQEGEIWALGKIKGYAQIKRIESSPLRLHVDLLELCAPTNNASGNACGLFKASLGRREILGPDSFSYLVNAELNGKKRFNIYPKEKEIWALYNKQDLKFVEVVENDGHIVKVLSLSRVPGYKSVFRASEMQSSKVSVLRLAYRVPAFLLTEEQDGRLRGCWELDLAQISETFKKEFFMNGQRSFLLFSVLSSPRLFVHFT